MSGVRKTIAVLILIFIGVPVLIGIIWAVGITRAVVSPEFLSEMPRDIINRVPALLDDTFKAVEREGAIRDENARAWVKAIANAETSPRELLEKVGVMNWLKTELSNSLEDIGKILRGDIKPRPVVLNMRPLKAALTHEFIDEYLVELMKKLPPCTDDQVKQWVEEAIHERPFKHEAPPACQPPDLVTAVKAVRQAWTKEVNEIEDEEEIFNIEKEDFFPRHGVNIAHFVSGLTYLLFFLPAIFLLLAAVIATSSGPGILRWIGVPTFIGGVLSFGISKLITRAVQWGVDMGPWEFSCPEAGRVPFSEVGEIFIEKMGDIIQVVTHHLFSSVNSVAGIVCIVGIVLIALSYLISRESHDDEQKPTPQPAPQSETSPAAK